MKKDTHPTYYPDAKVLCACGNTFTVGSTVAEINVELCNECHPFYTGKQKLVDTARRVEKFQERTSKKTDEQKASKRDKQVARSAKAKAKSEDK
jgi:large subunit ribosomal protein L31